MAKATESQFYKSTTKRQMFLILEQIFELIKEDGESWVDRAIEEREIIKQNGIR